MARELGFGGVVYATDDFFTNDKGEYVFDPLLIEKAHQWNYNRIKKAVENGISPVVIDNTNVTLPEMYAYVKLAHDNSYLVKFVEPDWNENLKDKDGKWNFDFIYKMQKERNKANKTKVIPEEVVRSMIDSYDYKKPSESDVEFANRIIAAGPFIAN